MRDLEDLNPNNARRLLRAALVEWPAAICATPIFGLLIWLTCGVKL